MKSQTPYVFTNLAISMDGKTSTKDRVHIDPTPYDRFMMNKIRARAGAILFGASSLRVFQRTATVEGKQLRLLRKARGLSPQPINLILSRRLDFDPQWPFFSDTAVEKVLVVPAETSESALAPYINTCRILKYDSSASAEKQILNDLKERKCQSLLLEGGGGIMFPWVEQDFIDEWNITISPKIIGGETAPTMVEGTGFDVNAVKAYRLRKVLRKKDELFLQYLRR